MFGAIRLIPLNGNRRNQSVIAELEIHEQQEVFLCEIQTVNTSVSRSEEEGDAAGLKLTISLIHDAVAGIRSADKKHPPAVAAPSLARKPKHERRANVSLL